MSETESRSHVVVNLTEKEASQLSHILDMADARDLDASESGTLKKTQVQLTKQLNGEGDA